ncbi:MAG: hypothetical protein KVP17_001225 [Porospora cf. gigantea B]|uniref:uncharacterized protein n=1 Tax=Porospora cf. gigantea B TaxID=2853592 RepID=UPI003571D494|nr:MAG: hypothetical protein KVP17_001225 [Porospora cf. gigantea B]
MVDGLVEQLPELRDRLGTDVTNNVLLAYLRRCGGDLQRAEEVFLRGPWGRSCRPPAKRVRMGGESAQSVSEGENLMPSAASELETADQADSESVATEPHEDPPDVQKLPPHRELHLEHAFPIHLGQFGSALFCTKPTAMTAGCELEFGLSVLKPLLKPRGGGTSYPYLKWHSARGWESCPHEPDMRALNLPARPGPLTQSGPLFGDPPLRKRGPKAKATKRDTASFMKGDASISSLLLRYGSSTDPRERLAAVLLSTTSTAGGNAAKTQSRGALEVEDERGLTVGRVLAADTRILVPLLVLMRVRIFVGSVGWAGARLGSALDIRVEVLASPALFQRELFSSFSVEAQTVSRSAVIGLVQKLFVMDVKTPKAEDESPEEDDSLEEAEEGEETEEGNRQTDALMGDDPSAKLMPDVAPNPQMFSSTLKHYQRQALWWMLQREAQTLNASIYEHAAEVLVGTCPAAAPPLPWVTLSLPDGPPLYFHPFNGFLCLSMPEDMDSVRGGILADEMGLGKTVQMLALISEDFALSSKPLDRKVTLTSLFNKAQGVPKTLIRKWRQDSSQHVGGTLVVLPLSLLDQWLSEISVHLGGCVSGPSNALTTFSYYGPQRDIPVAELAEYDIVLTTYGTVMCEQRAHDLENQPLWRVRWHRVILDEAHIIKARFTRTSRAVCSLPASRRWALTGTPIQNSIADAYSLLHFLKVQPWSQWSAFNQSILTPWEKGEEKAIKVLRAVLSPILLRRGRANRDVNGQCIVELPDHHVHHVWVEMTHDERAVYDNIFHQEASRFNEMVASGSALQHYTHVLQMLLRLRQCCCHPLLAFSAERRCGTEDSDVADALVGKFVDPETRSEPDERSRAPGSCAVCRERKTLGPGECRHEVCADCVGKECLVCQPRLQVPANPSLLSSVGLSKELSATHSLLLSGKLDALSRYLQRDSAEGVAVVVFTQWTSLMPFVENVFDVSKLPYRRFDGRMNQAERRATLQWFSQQRGFCVLLVSLRAGGVGLNLTSACRAYFLDLWWNPATMEQAMRRLHRIGQTRRVDVYILICSRTVEDRMLDMHRRKSEDARSALSSAQNNKLFSKDQRLEELKFIFEEFDK